MNRYTGPLFVSVNIQCVSNSLQKNIKGWYTIVDISIINTLIIVIGGFLTSVAIAILGKLLEKYMTPPVAINLANTVPLSVLRRRETQRRVLATVKIIAVALTLLFTANGIYRVLSFPTFLSSCPRFAKTNVSVTLPLKNANVHHTTLVEGTSCNVPQGQHLWLVVNSVGSNSATHYLQDGPIAISEDGAWSKDISIGDELGKSKGFSYTISTVLANDKVSALFLANYRKVSSQRKFLQFPLGSQLVGSTIVTLV
jgi:hypothetical protein